MWIALIHLLALLLGGDHITQVCYGLPIALMELDLGQISGIYGLDAFGKL